MKTKIKLFTIIFAFLCIAILLTPSQVSGAGEIEEVETYEQLRDALESGKSVKLMNNIEIDGNSVAQSSRSLGVAIIGTGDIIVDGNGFTVSDNDKTVRTNFEIYADGGGAVNVTLKNITIINAYTKGRALDTRTGEVTLNVVNSKIITTGASNTQALTIGGPTGPVNVNITNSNIEAKEAGYGIITYNPVNMTIKGSTVTGYSALYMKAADGSLGSKDSVITVKNSDLNGKNVYSGKTDNFGAVVFEDGGINITVEDSKVNAIGDGKASQAAFSESVNGIQSGVSFDKPNTINISGKSTINAKNELMVLLSNTNNTTGTKVTVASGVVSNKQIPNIYLATGTVNKELSNGTFVTGIEHTITINETKGGSVTVSQDKAIVGEIITITPKIQDGYQLKNLKVITVADNEVQVTDGKFVMPDLGVIVIAEFEKVEISVEEAPEKQETPVVQEKDETPKMGSTNISSYLWATLATIALLGIAITKKNRKNN